MKQTILQFSVVTMLTLAIAPIATGQAANYTGQYAARKSAPIVLAQSRAVRECPVDKNGKPYCGNNCPLCK